MTKICTTKIILITLNTTNGNCPCSLKKKWWKLITLTFMCACVSKLSFLENIKRVLNKPPEEFLEQCSFSDSNTSYIFLSL